MSLSEITVKYITSRLWAVRDGDLAIYRYTRAFRNIDHRDPQIIKNDQMLSLKSLFQHAYQTTQYYKEQFDKVEFDPICFKDTEQLKRIPILEREYIWNNQDKMISSAMPAKEMKKDSTGGSTGTPLVFYRDKVCFQKRKAQELFFDKWMGVDIGDKIALFVSPRHTPHNVKGIKAYLRNATSSRIMAFDPYQIDNEYMMKFAVTLHKYRPKIIKCFPNSLFIFANFLKTNGIDDIRPMAVSCTGETLYAHQRKLFEEVFDCPVFEKYAAIDGGVLACECQKHNGLHLFSPGAYFEVVNKDGETCKQGELGSIVFTDLFNYAMPFIRYRIGDLGIYTETPCSCGSNFPRLKKVLGRDRDILVDSDGNPKPGYLFVEVFNKNHLPGQFQVIQETKSMVVIKIVPMAVFTGEMTKIIQEKFSALLGKSIEINIKYVDNIPRDPSGKYRYVLSKVSPFTE